MFSIGISCEKTTCYPCSGSLTHRRSIPWNGRTYSGDENNVKWIQTISKKLLYSYRWNNNHSFISTRLELIITCKIVINIIVYLVIKPIHIFFHYNFIRIKTYSISFNCIIMLQHCIFFTKYQSYWSTRIASSLNKVGSNILRCRLLDLETSTKQVRINL